MTQEFWSLSAFCLNEEKISKESAAILIGLQNRNGKAKSLYLQPATSSSESNSWKRLW
jgi:hypothetical protein